MQYESMTKLLRPLLTDRRSIQGTPTDKYISTASSAAAFTIVFSLLLLNSSINELKTKLSLQTRLKSNRDYVTKPSAGSRATEYESRHLIGQPN